MNLIWNRIEKGRLVCDLALRRDPTTIAPDNDDEKRYTWLYEGRYYVDIGEPEVGRGLGSFIKSYKATKKEKNLRICTREVDGKIKLFYIAIRDFKFKEALLTVYSAKAFSGILGVNHRYSCDIVVNI